MRVICDRGVPLADRKVIETGPTLSTTVAPSRSMPRSFVRVSNPWRRSSRLPRVLSIKLSKAPRPATCSL